MIEHVPLPYGDTSIELAIPADKLLGVFEPAALPPADEPARTLRDALANPIGSEPLRDMARGKRSVAVTIEDVTRPVPNALLVDAVMSELHAGGIAPDHVRVIVATGLHRPLTQDELQRSLGKWAGKVSIENHDANDAARLVRLGTTSLGTDIALNRTFMEADLKVLTGDVEVHQFCGYGGGAKSVYPGLAGASAVRANHARMDIPGAEPGLIDDNPVRQEIDEVGRMARVDFNLSVALDTQHRIVAACAGNVEASFRQACTWVDRMVRVDVPRRADLVIASAGGHPKDIDLYQSQKAIEEATRVVAPGGDVLVFARCDEGSGSALFEQWMEAAHDPDDIITRIREQFVMGGHKAYQIARELQRARVHLYSTLPPGRVRAWMMHPVASIAQMESLITAANSIAVLPQATLTLTRLPEVANTT